MGEWLSERQVDTEDVEQLQQPGSAHLVGVALQRGLGLLRNAKAKGDLAVGETGLLWEGLEQRWQLLGGSDGERHTVSGPQSRFTAFDALGRLAPCGL